MFYCNIKNKHLLCVVIKKQIIMDFRNKYLKYKPEITFDIFEKIWNKLVADGSNPPIPTIYY